MHSLVVLGRWGPARLQHALRDGNKHTRKDETRLDAHLSHLELDSSNCFSVSNGQI